MIDFPTGASTGQTYTYGARTWTWNGAGWERQRNLGQNVAVFIAIGPLIQTYAGAFASPVSGAFHQLAYI